MKFPSGNFHTLILSGAPEAKQNLEMYIHDYSDRINSYQRHHKYIPIEAYVHNVHVAVTGRKRTLA